MLVCDCFLCGSLVLIACASLLFCYVVCLVCVLMVFIYSLCIVVDYYFGFACSGCCALNGWFSLLLVVVGLGFPCRFDFGVVEYVVLVALI